MAVSHSSKARAPRKSAPGALLVPSPMISVVIPCVTLLMTRPSPARNW